MPFDVQYQTQELLIDAKRVPAASGRYFETLNPATEQVLARVAEADAADIDAAVRSARAAFEGAWGHMRAADRGHALLRLADLIRQNLDELVELESLDSGKPVSAIRRQDLPAVLDTLAYYAGWADKINGQVIPARPDALTYTVREPVGVVAAIVPWNFPLMIAMWKIAPALACGCTVVLKPAELTPLSALRIGELALQAGFPPGVLNVVPGFGKTAGQALVDHPDVDKVTFTRLAGRRAADPAQRGGQPEARHPGTGRQVGQHHLRGRRPRCRDQGGGLRHLLQRRPGVLGRIAHPRARKDP
jgi:aldehyde dehydrogenase (NAD+)